MASDTSNRINTGFQGNNGITAPGWERGGRDGVWQILNVPIWLLWWC